MKAQKEREANRHDQGTKKKRHEMRDIWIPVHRAPKARYTFFVTPQVQIFNCF